jgi:hypothetical protein
MSKTKTLTQRAPEAGRAEYKHLARRLATHIVSAVDQAGARTVLVTSPCSGAGKSTLLRLISPELDHVAPKRYRAYGRRVLQETTPDFFPDDRIKLVDGPSMLEAEDYLGVSEAWMNAFDAALIVVMGRVSRRDQLQTTVDWLNACGIKPIGIVFNEHANPSFADRFARLGPWAQGKLSGFRLGIRRIFQRAST